MNTLEMKRLSLPATGEVEVIWNSRREAVSADTTGTVEHIHPCYEIYVHVSGDVSFATNDTMQVLSPGDVVLTRPYTSHHCITHTDCIHEHYCLFVYCEDALIKDALDRLAQRCFLRDSPDGTTQLLSLLQQITHALSQEPRPDLLEQRASLYRLIAQLSRMSAPNADAPRYPENLRRILHHISLHYASPLSVRELCRHFFISQATLERLFRHHLHTTPYRYLLQYRLSAAAHALVRGKSVGAAAEESGFSDYPHFISQFRKHFGMTPNQYKKAHASSIDAQALKKEDF